MRITGDGVDGDQSAFEAASGGELFEQHGDGGRFVALAVHRLLPEHETTVGGEGGDQMQRGAAFRTVMAAAHGLAVERNRVGRIGPAGAHPVHEAGGEQLRIDTVRHDVEPSPAGNAPIKGQETPEKAEMSLSPGADGVETVTIGNGRRRWSRRRKGAEFHSTDEPRLPDCACLRCAKSGRAEDANAMAVRLPEARRPWRGSESAALLIQPSCKL